MNVSHTTSTMDNAEDEHIAGSLALFVFIFTVSLLWMSVSWMFFLKIVFFCNIEWLKTESKCSPETIKYLRAMKRVKKIMRVLTFINFAILWLNMSVFIYCHCGSRNCVLHGRTADGTISLSISAGYTYLCQLLQAYWHPGRNCLNTTLQGDLLQSIFSEKPVITFGARCFHVAVEDTIYTHIEEAFLEFSRWKTVSVWREGVCGFYQVALTGESGISISGHTRVKITVLACAGDQVTSLQWLNEYNALKDKHPKGLHDESVAYYEDSTTSSLHFISDTPSFCSSKIVRLGYCVSGLLGLGPVYRLILFFALPELHYVIEQHVFSSSENVEAAPCNDVLALHVNAVAYHVYSRPENIQAASCNDALALDVNSLTYPERAYVSEDIFV